MYWRRFATRLPSILCMWYRSCWILKLGRPTLRTNSTACPVVRRRYGPFSKVLTASTTTSIPEARASSAANPTFSRASESCSSRSVPGSSCPRSMFILRHPTERANSSATGTFSRNSSLRSRSPARPLSPAAMSPALKFISATETPASLTALATASRSSTSLPGHQNSTAPKPASATRANRSRNGTSLNKMETLTLNLIALLPQYGSLSSPHRTSIYAAGP